MWSSWATLSGWSFSLKFGRRLVEGPDSKTNTPIVTAMRVIPVAGHDSMLLNLSGAHAPFFTRNLVVLTDNAGRTGAGEVPGGEKIEAAGRLP